MKSLFSVINNFAITKKITRKYKLDFKPGWQLNYILKYRCLAPKVHLKSMNYSCTVFFKYFCIFEMFRKPNID